MLVVVVVVVFLCVNMCVQRSVHGMSMWHIIVILGSRGLLRLWRYSMGSSSCSTGGQWEAWNFSSSKLPLDGIWGSSMEVPSIRNFYDISLIYIYNLHLFIYIYTWVVGVAVLKCEKRQTLFAVFTGRFLFFFRTFSEKAGVELLVATPGRYLGGNPIHLIVAGWDWWLVVSNLTWYSQSLPSNDQKISSSKVRVIPFS